MNGEELPFLDPACPDFSIQSEEVLAARQKSWCARTPYGLAVLRYAELKEMIMHPLLRQGSYRWPSHNDAHGLWAQWWLRIMLNREGADHARLRRLGQPAFAPKLVSELIPEFQSIAAELISNFAPRGECEFMSEFADPYATRVICSLIGLSHDNWQELAELAVDMGLALGVTYKADEARVDKATECMFEFARELVETRKSNPKEDFISSLLTVNENKDALSDQELLDMIVLTIFGGIDTTRNQLGLAMNTFVEHSDQWEVLRQNPELARSAVEEVMRTRPTVTWVTREACETFEYQGVEIKKGTTLHLFSQSAASDPEHFEPGFDITKKKLPHFGFGGGRHHCIGSPIARGDMTEALKLLSEKLINPRYNGSPDFLPDSGNTGLNSLPLKFETQVT